MALGEVLRHAKLLLGRGKRQKPQLVGQCGLGNAKPPGPGLLCATPKVQQLPQRTCLFKRVQLFALDIL